MNLVSPRGLPLAPHAASTIVAIRHHLCRLVVSRVVAWRAPPARATRVPEAAGATEAELRQIASAFGNDPVDRIWTERTALTLLSRWWM